MYKYCLKVSCNIVFILLFWEDFTTNISSKKESRNLYNNKINRYIKEKSEDVFLPNNTNKYKTKNVSEVQYFYFVLIYGFW